MNEIIKKNHKYIVVFLLTFMSVFCFYYFFINNQLLLYGDSLSRLNISRKIIDNLTPGLAQLGNVWLPLPQMLMLMFIWNDSLWHSGIAGSVISMSAFIIGGIFLYKAARVVSHSILSSLFALCIYAFNINLLYLQTTAMSEPIFITSIIISTYYFLQWMENKNKVHYLMLAGISVSAATLIRYEALAFLAASIPLVFYYSWKIKGSYHKAEGNVIMYTMLACLGFAMWTLYLTVIFGDPLYWKNYYAGTQVVQTTSTVQIQTYANNLNIFQAFWKYFSAVVWMNGLIPTLLAVISVPIVLADSIRNKKDIFIPIFLSLSMFLFMILTLQRNTPISQPDLTIKNLLSFNTQYYAEFNIRYGLIMLPFISLISVYLFKQKLLIINILLFSLLIIQYYSYFKPAYSVIFQLPVNVSGNITQGTLKEKQMVYWLKKNYNGGLIMISALKHDPQMLQLGLQYKTYIHEGAGKYWKESKTKPQKYASWIVFDSINKDDQVTKYLNKSPLLNKYYNLVYDSEGMKIYKIRKTIKPIL